VLGGLGVVVGGSVRRWLMSADSAARGRLVQARVFGLAVGVGPGVLLRST